MNNLTLFISKDKALGEVCNPNVSGECSDPNALCLDNDTATRCTCRTGYFKFNNNGVDNCELGMYNSLVYLSYYICRLTMERCQVSTGHKQLI